ncbi:hypothetical protein AAEX37_01111 [Oligella sp. MSHR50489EDL]
MPIDVIGEQAWFDSTIERIPLVRNGTPIKKKYCAFRRKDNLGPHIEDFDPSQKSRQTLPLKRMLISQEKLTCPNALVQNLNNKLLAMP